MVQIIVEPQAYSDFYAALGMCVTASQAMEDRLPFVFWVSLRGSRDRSDAIFAEVQGFDRRQNLIRAALLDEEETIQAQWDGIAARIKQHVDFRNKIAHAQVEVIGAGLRVRINEAGQPVGLERFGDARMQARKKTNSGNVETISREQMIAEFDKMRATSTQLSTFINVMRVRLEVAGISVPDDPALPNGAL